MKKSILISALILFTSIAQVAFAFNNDNKSKYTIDKNKSSVKWTGYKVLGQHQGSISIKTGNLNFKNGKLSGGVFEIDMSSINNTDLEGEWKSKLENHLKSDDFFGVEEHPVSKLIIKNVSFKNNNGKAHITAKITIKSITQTIEFDADVNSIQDELSITSKITIDRAKFNVKYGSGSFFSNLGDKAIKDEFVLDVKLVAKKS